jgi:predicted transcriptional regulator
VIDRAELLAVLKAIGTGRTLEVVVAVLEADDERGCSQSEIERATGLDRRTISRAIEHATEAGVLEARPVKARIRYGVGRTISNPQTGKNSTNVDSESHNETGINSTMVDKIHQTLADPIHNGGENPPNDNGTDVATRTRSILKPSKKSKTLPNVNPAKPKRAVARADDGDPFDGTVAVDPELEAFERGLERTAPEKRAFFEYLCAVLRRPYKTVDAGERAKVVVLAKELLDDGGTVERLKVFQRRYRKEGPRNRGNQSIPLGVTMVRRYWAEYSHEPEAEVLPAEGATVHSIDEIRSPQLRAAARLIDKHVPKEVRDAHARSRLS